MTIVKIEADGQESCNNIFYSTYYHIINSIKFIYRSSSNYEPSDNELTRKYYKKKEKRNEGKFNFLITYIFILYF